MEKADLRRTCLAMLVGVIFLGVVGAHLYISIAEDPHNPYREVQSIATAILFLLPMIVILACMAILFLQSLKRDR